MFNRIIKQFKAQRARGRRLQYLTAMQDDQAEQLMVQEAAFNRQVAIVALTGATAVIHISLGTQIFVLNGLGYLALLGAHLVAPDRESYRSYTRSALFGYTGVTVVGYFALRGVAGFANPTGVLSKLIELGLMHVLWVDRGSAGVLAAAELDEFDAPVEQVFVTTVETEPIPV